MKGKTPLILMEQMIMLLVFAFAAALCLKAFVLSDVDSRQLEEKDRAILLTQSAAETIRSCGGDIDHALSGTALVLGGSYAQGSWELSYDEQWNPAQEGGIYRLSARPVASDIDGLCKACVEMTEEGETGEAEVLFSLQIAWQEVSTGEQQEQ